MERWCTPFKSVLDNKKLNIDVRCARRLCCTVSDVLYCTLLERCSPCIDYRQIADSLADILRYSEDSAAYFLQGKADISRHVG